MGVFKNVHKLPVAASDLGDGGFPRRLLGPPVNERIPESCPAYCKANEPRNAGRYRQPLAHLFVVLASPQDDAADFVATAPVGSCHNLLAVLAAVQSLDLPDVRLHPSGLELLNGPDHQPRAQLPVVGLLVTLELLELRLLRRHQQLEHKQPAALAMQVVRQPLQPGCLPAVERLVALRVVAHQHLTEGGVESLNMFGEVLAVLELKLLLPALLGGTCAYVTLR